MFDGTNQPVVFHFLSGAIEQGILQSSLAEDKSVRYLPQHFSNGRRKVPRVSFIKEVCIDRNATRRAIDLSTRGIYVESLTSYSVGTMMQVSFELDKLPMDLKARVAFNDPGIGMGLEFQDLPLSWRLKIESTVKDSLKKPNHRFPWDRRLTPREPGTQGRGALKDAGVRGETGPVTKGPGSKASVEVNMNRLKTLFFLESERDRTAGEQAASASKHEIEVEFVDGEKVQGLFTGFSPTAMGFFFDAYVSDRTSYTLYIVKQSLKNIQYL